MKNKIIKFLVVLFSIWLLLKTIEPLFLDKSISRQMWSYYHITWLGFMIVLSQIAFILLATVYFLKNKTKTALKYALFFTLAGFLFGLTETFLGLPLQEKMPEWYFESRQQRGLPITRERAEMLRNTNMTSTYIATHTVSLIILGTTYFLWRKAKDK